MTRDEIVQLVLSRLGKREANTYLYAQAQAELIHIIQTKLERGPLLPWFLLSAEEALVVTANTRLAIALPDSFLREWDEFPISLYSASAAEPYTELNKDDYDLNISRYQGQGPGTPAAYTLVNDHVAVFPLASVDLAARWVYFKKQDVTGNYENAWCTKAADVLLGELGVVMARYTRSDMLSEFKEDRSLAYTRLLTEDTARKNAAREAFRGDQ